MSNTETTPNRAQALVLEHLEDEHAGVTSCPLCMGSAVYQHQRAANGSNGNPRRLWAVMATTDTYGRLLAVVDEGYANVPRALRADAVELPSVDITGPAYTRTIRQARASGTLVEAR